MSDSHFTLSVTERGTVSLYWADGKVWEGPVSALQELERMIGAFSFHREYNPSLLLRLSVGGGQRMSEYLTPEEIEQMLKAMDESWFSKAEVATLRAYAKVVEAVADNPIYCCGQTNSGFCCVQADVVLLARELRGHAE